MKGVSKSQKALVSQFEGITGADAITALELLKTANWNLEGACNQYLDGGASAAYESRTSSVDQTSVARLFGKYKDPQSDMILAEGVGMFCEDLEVDPIDVVMLVVSYHFQAANSCEYTRQEFLQGMTKLGCDSISKLKNKLPELQAQLQDSDVFQEIYNYAYFFSREKGQKCVQLDMAISMWQLIFSQRPWPLLDAWLKFLEAHHKCAISRDTWVQLLDFIKTVEEDLSEFDTNAVTSAWPYLFDVFIDFLKANPDVAKSEQDDNDVVMLEAV